MPPICAAAPTRSDLASIRELDLPGLIEVLPRRFTDVRGYFEETWNAARWRDLGVDCHFVQDNHSFSRDAGVLRGLHYQIPPMAQDKLVRVSRGSVFDVAVDIREGSPTFGHWVGVTLSAEKGNQLFVPKGFAHGFVTLEANCEVQYKVSALYSPQHERAIRFDDPSIAIKWPFETDRLVLSEKDEAAPMLRRGDTGFSFP